MEENTQHNIFDEMEFDAMARNSIETMAQWALVIAVIGIATSVIGLAQLFLAPYNLMESSQNGLSGVMGSSIIASKFFGVIFIGIGLLMNLFLYLFASNAKRSSQAGDGRGIGRSFIHLKSYFMVISIILVIVFAFTFLGGLAGLV